MNWQFSAKMDGKGGKTMAESKEKKIPVLFSHPEARGRSHQGEKNAMSRAC